MKNNILISRVGLHPDVNIKPPIRKPILPSRTKQEAETAQFHDVLLKAMERHNQRWLDRGSK